MPGYRTKPPKGSLLQRSHPLARGLVGAWLFNEGSGLTAYDSAGRNNGTLTNGPTWGAGVFGKCLMFDGSNDWINTDLIPPTTGTYSFWFNSRSFAASLIPISSITWAHRGVVLSSVAVDVIATNQTDFTWVFATGWHHLTMTFTPSACQAYVNGVALAPVVSAASPNATNTNVNIGCRNNSGNVPFNGQIDAVCIWNRILSDREIRTNYLDPFAAFRRKSLLKHPASSLLLKRRRAALS